VERDQIEKKVREIVVEQCEITEEQIKPESSFLDDLGLDSLDCIEVVMEAEEEFNLEFPDADLNEITTVEQFVDLIHTKIKETA
jgi:acyl carrier protein